MSLIVWSIFGIMIALCAHILDRKKVYGGMTGALLLGAAGALLGGFVANIIFGQQLLRLDVATFLLSLMGALLLVSVHRTVLLK